jgi:hypothetical protein
MDDTAETSGIYPGQAGHSYAFYSVAKDNVGHVEGLPGAADAQISVMPVYDNRQMDVAVWRPGDGFWYIINSEDGSITSVQWGAGDLNDKPIPGDYDGDGITDIGVYRPGEYAYWYILQSSDGGVIAEQWGSTTLGDVPVPGDYDGDGITDIAVWRPGGDYGFWYIMNSEDGSITSTQWGAGSLNDIPVPADYDGDGKTDIAVWRPGEYAYWYIIDSKDGSIISQQWGSSILNDAVVPGDYDGDRKTDIAVWRPGGDYGYWYIINSEDGSITSTQWGAGSLSDMPVATASAPASGMGGGLMMMGLVASSAESISSLNTDSASTFTQVANLGGVDALAYRANDEVLSSESSSVDFGVKKLGARGGDFEFDSVGRDGINRGSHRQARLDDSKHDLDGVPVRSSLIDISGKHEDFFAPGYGDTTIDSCPSWTREFVGDLATRNDRDLNRSIKITLHET